MTNSKNTPTQTAGTLSRRSFLASASSAAASAVAIPTCLARVAIGQSPAGTRDVLVTVFLHGAMDGLSAVVPVGDAAYGAMRGAPQPDLLVTPNIWLDSQQFFGLNPNADALAGPWSAGALAIVHSAGLATNGTRSHFDATARMQSGSDSPLPLSDGWVGRVLQQIPGAGLGLRAAALSNVLPRMYMGAPQTLPISNPATFAFPSPALSAAFRKIHLTRAFDATLDPILGSAGVTTLSAIDAVEATDTGSYGLGAGYPTSALGQSFRNVAALLTSPHLNLEAAHIDYGGWDHHDNLGPMSGTFAGMIQNLANSMRAFYDDLAGTGINYTLVVQTEFGRRIIGNLSGGLDHGKGSVMFVMGPNVSGGGEVITNGWNASQNPANSPLLPGNNDAGDLPIEIDYRDILAEICMDRLGLTQTDIDVIFPGLGVPTTWGVTF